MNSEMDEMKLWYDRPADVWVEALPVGNGRIGGMVFGGIKKERIQLNEDTLWSGFPRDTNNADAALRLKEVRELIFNGEYVKSQRIIEESMLGPYNESYQPLGNLYLEFEGNGSVTDYRRELDLETAVVRITYKQDGVNITREIFTSVPDQVMVVKVKADVKGGISLKAHMDSLMKNEMHTKEQGIVVMNGRCPSHVEPSYIECDNNVIYSDKKGMSFEVQLGSVVSGGSVICENNQMSIINADSVTFVLSTATSFNGFDRDPEIEGKDPSAVSKSFLEPALKKEYKELYNNHVDEYKKLFSRVQINLGTTKAMMIPTDERLKAYDKGVEDPQLISLFFQYGRYLLISSSRPGTQPANLQGIWNNEVRPPWSSNLTTNINAQMNYWPAEVCNLSECHEPLFDMLDELKVKGTSAAEINYNCKGWVANHNVDIWRSATAVNGSARWAYWPMGGAWLCQHLWEHYAFSKEKGFLEKRAYPIMKEAALFCMDWMVKDKEGYWVTCPSISPENAFITKDGDSCNVSMGSTMDMSIIRLLFTNCIEATEILAIDEEFSKQLQDYLLKLYPYKISKDGKLQEWFEDFEEEEPQHRHLSNLFGLYPGCQIHPLKDPLLSEACKATLNRRGDDGTGWSLAWKVNLWARLGDGNHALKLIRRQLKPVTTMGLNYVDGGGTYPNLFDAHPPFQIDGNFGVTAGISEMLLQSHCGTISLLPALPDEWDNGYVKGLRARGGFEIDIEWECGKLKMASIWASTNLLCNVSYKGKMIVLNLEKGCNTLCVNSFK